jgi:hypothetical protein
MLIDGIEKAKNQTNIPHQFLINTILDFKSQGCKNEWIHKSLIIKDFGVKAILFCRLTTNYFSLTLILFKKNKKIFKKEILRELPSKICYSNEFDDIIYKKNKLIVTKKLQLQSESPLAEFNIAEILEAISEAPAKR